MSINQIGGKYFSAIAASSNTVGKLYAFTLTYPKKKRISRRLKFNLLFYYLQSINYKKT